MGSISTGLGLFSGIDGRSIIDQLLQIEARPKFLAQGRLFTLQNQQAALLDLNSALLALQTASGAFKSSRVFDANTATSSDPNALTATAGFNAAAGTYSFTTDRLVSTDQHISRGFADKDVAGLGAPDFTFEVGGGRVDTETRLTELNGGLGIDRGQIRVTDSAGTTVEIDLSRAVTINDVLNAINSKTTLGVTASATDDGFVLTDTAGGAGTLSVADVFGSETATSLQIAGSAVGGVITGGSIYTLAADTPLSILNDGRGIAFGDGGPGAVADFQINVEDSGGGNGTLYDVVLGDVGAFVDDEFVVSDPTVVTIGDFIARIESATSGEVTAVIDAAGTGLELQTTSGTRQLTVNEGALRETGAELGILGQTGGTVSSARLFAGLNTVLLSSLNGGAGVQDGDFTIALRDGVTNVSVSVTANDTLSSVIEQINGSVAGQAGQVQAALNRAGNGIQIIDTSAATGDTVITDDTGTAATDLGIATAGESDGIVESGNLQHQWIGRATRLDDLSAGQGVGEGTVRFTDSLGASATLDITDSIRTMDDLIIAINGRGLAIQASLNSTGDGLALTDTGGGSNAIKVEDTEGRTAKRLNIAGEAEWESGDAPEDNLINGSYERAVTFDATDTLEDIAAKISSAGVGVDASVISDGSGPTPYRIVFTSETTGSVGRVTVDTGDFNLGLSTLTRGEDAVVFFGSSNAADALLLTSSTNTLDGAVAGVTIDLNTTTDTAVEVNVTRDTGKIEETVDGFIEAYNNVLERMDFHERFDAETKVRGPLFGDTSAANIRSTLFRTIQSRPMGTSGDFDFLVQIGLTSGTGGRLEFDRDRFRDAYEQDPAGVEALVAGFAQSPNVEEEIQPGVFVTPTTETFTELGVMEQIKKLSKDLTNSVDGLLTRRRQTLDTQIRLQNDRIEAFDQQLLQKQARLEREFIAMETAIANLSSQQQAMSALAFGG